MNDDPVTERMTRVVRNLSDNQFTISVNVIAFAASSHLLLSVKFPISTVLSCVFYSHYYWPSSLCA